MSAQIQNVNTQFSGLTFSDVASHRASYQPAYKAEGRYRVTGSPDVMSEQSDSSQQSMSDTTPQMMTLVPISLPTHQPDADGFVEVIHLPTAGTSGNEEADFWSTPRASNVSDKPIPHGPLNAPIIPPDFLAERPSNGRPLFSKKAYSISTAEQDMSLVSEDSYAHHRAGSCPPGAADLAHKEDLRLDQSNSSSHIHQTTSHLALPIRSSVSNGMRQSQVNAYQHQRNPSQPAMSPSPMPPPPVSARPLAAHSMSPMPFLGYPSNHLGQAIAQDAAGNKYYRVTMTPEVSPMPQTMPMSVAPSPSPMVTPFLGDLRSCTSGSMPPLQMNQTCSGPRLTPSLSSLPSLHQQPSLVVSANSMSPPFFGHGKQLMPVAESFGIFGKVTCWNICDIQAQAVVGCAVSYVDERGVPQNVEYNPISVSKEQDGRFYYVVFTDSKDDTRRYRIAFPDVDSRKKCMWNLERKYNLKTMQIIGNITIGKDAKLANFPIDRKYMPRNVDAEFFQRKSFELAILNVHASAKIKDVKRIFNAMANVKHVQMPVHSKKLSCKATVFLTLKNLESALRVLTVMNHPIFANEFGGLKVDWSHHEGATIAGQAPSYKYKRNLQKARQAERERQEQVAAQQAAINAWPAAVHGLPRRC